MLTTAIIAAVIVLAIIAVLAYAATKPDSFRVERATTINAAPDKIFPLVDDLHAHSSWSPFEKDPNMKRTHSGAPKGKGAIYEWEGNRQVGKGRIAITDVTPPSKVTMQLDMFTPFEAHNIVEFTLVPNGSGTKVNWAMHGPQPFMAKVMSTFINCDKMVGSEFERGLAKMKAIAEA
jgi:uncharacterized protein YndB with AHSA1/START domain